MTSFDTFHKVIEIGDTVVVGSHSLDAMITYSGEFYECEVMDIDPIEYGPYGDILYLKKDKYGRNLQREVILNKQGKFSEVDVTAVDNEYEMIQIFSQGVIKVSK